MTITKERGNMQSIKLTYHSFIDVITNSSTSIFSTVAGTAISTVGDLVNNLLKIANSDLTFDDLFTIEIIDDSSDERRKDKMYKIFKNELVDLFGIDCQEFIDDKFNEIKKLDKKPDWWNIDYDYDEFEENSIKVTAKSGNKNSELVANILSNLEELFCVEASCQT